MTLTEAALRLLFVNLGLWAILCGVAMVWLGVTGPQ